MAIYADVQYCIIKWVGQKKSKKCWRNMGMVPFKCIGMHGCIFLHVLPINSLNLIMHDYPTREMSCTLRRDSFYKDACLANFRAIVTHNSHPKILVAFSYLDNHRSPLWGICNYPGCKSPGWEFPAIPLGCKSPGWEFSACWWWEWCGCNILRWTRCRVGILNVET